MSVPVTFTFGTLPIGYCFTTPQQFAQDILALISGSVTGITGINYGNNTPVPANRGMPWQRTNADGTPDGPGMYVFAEGLWTRPHTVPPSSQFRWIWRDTESALWNFDGGDGTNPVTNPPTDTTGAMWQRDTDFGKDDGSIPFSIPVGVGTNSASYDGNAASSIALGSRVTSNGNAGEERHYMSVNELVQHLHMMLARADLAGSGNITCATGGFSNTADVPTKNTGNEAGTSGSMNNMPPFLGVFFVKRTARKFYTQAP